MISYDWPFEDSPVFETPGGVPYLIRPGLALVAQTVTDFGAWNELFLGGFNGELKFDSWADDETPLTPTGELIKAAGQLCYLSFGPKRTWNHDIEKYAENILVSGHGSVLEHANFSFLIWGASRSFTHELVRHRAGWAYSQVSQRYVMGSTLRFVERLEFQEDPVLHQLFLDRIERTKREYDQIAEHLLAKQKPAFGASKTELRKLVNQVAREVLMNETEAPILVTANLRSWRHFFAMRGSEKAEVQIRRIAVGIAKLLMKVAPEFLGDVTITDHPLHGELVRVGYSKV